MIELENIEKHFDQIAALRGISLNVQEGEIFGLVGPDGAGKTTLIRIMTGILAADKGSLSILNQPDSRAIKDEIGYVPQKFSLYGDLTVMENIRLIGSLYGKNSQDIESLAADILAFTKLLPFKDRLADQLSGGMKQKLALAAGLLHRPRLFFLDEPTTGVDPVSRREFWQMLYGLNKQGTTIFVSTPYMDEADLCTRIAFMQDGRIVACATPAELRSRYPYRLLELEAEGKHLKPYFAHLVKECNAFGDKFHLVVENPDRSAILIREALAQAGIKIHSLKEISPSLEDVFVALASEVN